MIQLLRYTIGCTVTLALICLSFAYAQDRIEHRRDGKLITTSGQIIEDSASGIKLKSGTAKEIFISGSDINKINFELTGILKQELGPILALDEKREYTKALSEYRAIEGKVKANEKASPSLKRYIDFRIASLSYYTQKEDAKIVLANFLKNHTNSWQYPMIANQLVSMHLDKAEYSEASKTLETLTGMSGLSPTAKQSAELLQLDILLMEGKFPELKTKADALTKSIPSADLASKKLQLYQAIANSTNDKPEAVAAKIQKLIESNPNPSVKACGYNILGNYFIAQKNKREAMWQFLWVDTVYNKDPNERVKALDQLARLFETDFKDAERALTFREKAQKYR